MNVISMMHEINLVANPVIGETALPHLALSANDVPEFMGICAFDKLDRALDGYVDRGSQQEMDVFRHKDKRMQRVAAFTTMPVKRLQEKAEIQFDDKQRSAVVGRKGYEICSGWGDESSRLQGETSAAESRASFSSLNCTSGTRALPGCFLSECFHFGKTLR